MTKQLLIVDAPGRERRLVLQGDLSIDSSAVEASPPAAAPAFDLILDTAREPEQLGEAIAPSPR